jgi:hypothetical protein
MNGMRQLHELGQRLATDTKKREICRFVEWIATVFPSGRTTICAVRTVAKRGNSEHVDISEGIHGPIRIQVGIGACNLYFNI